MDSLTEQIVEQFPKEDKVFSKTNKILKGYTFPKDLFSNSRRNRGIIVMVPSHAVDFISICVTHVKKLPNNPTTHPLQKLSLTLYQVGMKMMKRNL